ncbi:hydrogenase maturation protease [Mycobacterium sp.]|uniref:hydrogenase maturation protease n=1 Tax=Mycobacterium sp. TaxID=1785 RepID=UPI0025EB2888|nr:hydrogenase maturation protease [Mycobacterium sp.]MBW0014507.1 hydrogenase maturation protease [Mycobacterium sp.]
MTGEVVVVGLGNSYRKDDGVGAAAAAALHLLALPHVRVVTGIAEPTELLEVWSGARLVVVIDGAAATPPTPGRVRRCQLSDVVCGPGKLSCHRVDIGPALELGKVLGRVPDDLVVITVDVADTGHGVGLTPAVARAVPEAVRMAVGEIERSSAPRAERAKPDRLRATRRLRRDRDCPAPVDQNGSDGP